MANDIPDEITRDNRLCWTPALVRHCRMKGGWSLAELVQEFNRVFPEPGLKISKNQILEYETGSSMPRVDRIAMLADVMRVDVSFFFTRSVAEAREKMGPAYEEVMASLQRRGPTYLDRKN